MVYIYKRINVNSDYGLCWLVELDDGDSFKKTIKPIMHGPTYDRWSFSSFLWKQRGFQEKRKILRQPIQPQLNHLSWSCKSKRAITDHSPENVEFFALKK